MHLTRDPATTSHTARYWNPRHLRGGLVGDPSTLPSSSTSTRAIVGWSAATHKRAKLVLDALQMGLWRRDRDGCLAQGHGKVMN